MTAAPRFGPLTPQTWPQLRSHAPTAMAEGMPAIETANAQRSKQESFTISGTFTVAQPSAAGATLNLYLPTDQDGDFWCDQIYMAGWVIGAGGFAPQTRPPPSTISIGDARTRRRLTYPGAIPTNFLTTLILFSDDAGFDAGSSPYPDGFRSTSTLAQPFCFTRAGGIELSLTVIPSIPGASTTLVDIAFGGWKEYEFASQN